jgi:hypothetical protein
MVVLRRQWFFDYAINIYDDGTVMFQSFRCPTDRRLHVKKIPSADLARLRAAFHRADLALYRRCQPDRKYVAEEGGWEVLAFYDAQRETILITSGGPQLSELRDLADRVDRVAGSGEWIPATAGPN